MHLPPQLLLCEQTSLAIPLEGPSARVEDRLGADGNGCRFLVGSFASLDCLANRLDAVIKLGAKGLATTSPSIRAKI